MSPCVSGSLELLPSQMGNYVKIAIIHSFKQQALKEGNFSVSEHFVITFKSVITSNKEIIYRGVYLLACLDRNKAEHQKLVFDFCEI